MDKLFETLDPKLRVIFSLSFGLLALLAGCVALWRLTVGPWFLVLMLAITVGISLALQSKMWPSCPPQPLNDILEQWNKVKSKSNKTVANRVVWNMGRSVIAGMLAFQFLEMVSDVSGLFRIALIAGFSVSAGFFGIGASVWAGIIIFLTGHQLALSGLNVDFADRASREALDKAWLEGGSMSWWWLIGLGLAAPIWIGLSAVIKKVGAQIVEEMAERALKSAAKNKIDARRARLRGRREADGADPVAAAIKARKEAQERVEAVATGKAGVISGGERALTDSTAVDGPSNGQTELSGVAKLEYEKNAAILERYIATVFSINESIKNGIDVNTANRRSFDRVIQSMDDKQIQFLYSGKLKGSDELIGYYNNLCGIEHSAISGGDGLPVTSSPVFDDVLENEASQEDNSEFETVSFDRSNLAPPVLNNIYEDDADLLDQPQAPLVVRGRGSVLANMELMLSPSLDPTIGGEKQGAGQTDDDQSAPNNVPIEIASVDVFGGAETLETGVMQGVLVPGQQIQAPDSDDADETAGVNPNEAEQGANDDLEHGATGKHDTNHEGVGQDDKGALLPENDSEDPIAGGGEQIQAPGSDDADQAGEVKPDEGKQGADDMGAVPPENDSESPIEGEGGNPSSIQEDGNLMIDGKELHVAAGAILAGKLDRDFVIRSQNYFETAADAGRAIGLDEAMFDTQFPIYKQMVAGAKLEAEISDLLKGNDVHAMRRALAQLNSLDWEALPENVLAAETWLEIRDQDNREREEVEAAAEAARQSAEEEMRLKAEDDARVAGEQKRREEEAAALAERERQEFEAEEKRIEALKEERRQHAVNLLLGTYKDDLLDMGEDLFPTVEALAEALNQDPNVVQKQFDDFTAKRKAKERLNGLRQAWQAQDLHSVEALVEDSTKFEAYPGYEEVLDGARDWAKGEVAKQRVLGLSEHIEEIQNTADEDTRKKFMCRMHKTTAEQVDLIERKLPAALLIVKSLGIAISAMGDNVSPGIEKDHANASAESARLAAEIVAGSKTCREYAKAFFPKEHRPEDSDVWSMLTNLAEKVPALEAETEAETEAEEKQSETKLDTESPELPERSVIPPRTLDDPKVLSAEDVQKLDPAEQIALIEPFPLKDLSSYERSYQIACMDVFENGLDVRTQFKSTGHLGCSIALGNKHGVELGRLQIFTILGRVPVWYHEATDKIYMVDADRGPNKARGGSEWLRTIQSYFGPTPEPKDQVQGLIVVCPYITPEGIKSFEPLLNKYQNHPIMIHNHALSADVISAFVDKIKGA